MKPVLKRISHGIKRRWVHSNQNRHLVEQTRLVAEQSPATDEKPVIFFNASTRLGGLSLNAGFSLVASWSLRLSGVPVVYFACQRGLSHCVLGTDRDQVKSPPPCNTCINQTQKAYSNSDVHWFSFEEDPALACLIEELDLEGLMDYVYQGMPVGRLVLPSIRWILRRHNLIDNDSTRYLYRSYILSAWHVSREFRKLAKQVMPQAVVVFNGMFYPEAAVRWVAEHAESAIRVISHEVALQPFSAFFTDGEATAYPIDIPDDFELNQAQSQQLDEYLSQRFKGNFSMAGIQFWPEMRPMSQQFWEKTKNFKHIVPVFTNVIFDTSQDHANVLFSDMFAWLDTVTDFIKQHRDTYFVIRAHPDETRPGKESLESVAHWIDQSGIEQFENVQFVRSNQFFSSYELIQRSKFVMIYNSTIGLEAAILGAPVLCAGKARFTQLPTVFFPDNVDEYIETAEQMLSAEIINLPEVFQQNARKFLYYQLFRTSLPFGDFLEEDGVWKGYVSLKPLKTRDYLPENSKILRLVTEGILQDKPFLLEL